jgi:hypothetical protein
MKYSSRGKKWLLSGCTVSGGPKPDESMRRRRGTALALDS